MIWGLDEGVARKASIVDLKLQILGQKLSERQKTAYKNWTLSLWRHPLICELWFCVYFTNWTIIDTSDIILYWRRLGASDLDLHWGDKLSER